MSAFAVIYDRSGGPLEPGLLGRIMERLSHRGPDGQDALVSGPLAMGHWHFWTTPEEVGERQPLRVNGLPFTLVFDGRLDNREELFAALSISVEEGRPLSDAALVLRAYAAWGESCVERFIGEFALALFDERSHNLFCARDQLGDRTLFYAQHGSRVLIASEPWAVVGAQPVPVELDERALAYYFALRATPDGQTLFKDVLELLPAHAILINEQGVRMQRYWQPDYESKTRYKTDQEYADHFRDLLEESVRCRMRSTTPVGVLMSGGLDSTSVACLAARMIAPQQLTTISYVFDELPDCDERIYINAVQKRWQTRAIQILCDDAWPFKELDKLHLNPNQPEGNPYREMKERAYACSKSEGLRVLLTGGFGDHLYSGAQNSLADMLWDGHFTLASRELFNLLQAGALLASFRSAQFRLVVRRILGLFPFIRDLQRPSRPSPWLSSYTVRLTVAEWKSSSIRPSKGQLRGNLIGLKAADSSSREIRPASLHSVELRHPYRDRRLVEYFLGLPAYQFWQNGQYKYILRQSFIGILPDVVRLRAQQTSIVSLFARGLERERVTIEDFLNREKSRLNSFINFDMLGDAWIMPLTRETDGPQVLLSWMCASYLLWQT